MRYFCACGGLMPGGPAGWETAGVFVVDDLVGWLVGRVADAGYQKLTTLLRGSDQVRALKQAVTAAVKGMVGELGFFGGEADLVAGQINRAFGRRDPVPLPPGQLTVLEALQAGIAGQLSVLDDAGQPVVSVPGVLVGEVAAKLTGHLLREIQVRGSRGGPLADLADQLNHDVTHLQGQRLEGMLAQVLDWLGHGQAPPGGTAGPPGWPLAEVGDPFALEVHRPVEPAAPQPGLPVLPAYVPREHDTALAAVVAAAARGASGIAVLVGGSSTGKTRACWQALDPLRGLEPGWRLWHPIDSQAALAGLPGAGPRTVVWLNEAQRYLDPADGTGERVAAGLRELLREEARGPVLVLATLWPEFWARLRGAGQARELLDGHNIPVPAAFTEEHLRTLVAAGDPRLAQAVAGSRDGQVIQYLAGAPELLARYQQAPPAARALIDAAMDANRLGMSPALPQAFLAAAAAGYLTDTDWDLLDDDWLEEGLAYTKKRAKGIRGPLAPIRPRPDVPARPAGGSAWQLADYLDQHGRRYRREEIPPVAFWLAAATYADPAHLTVLAQAAADRGLLRDAARLYKQASGQGDPEAGTHLVRLLHTLYPGDQRPAGWAAAHASLDNLRAVAELLDALRETAATSQVTALASRAAADASLDDPDDVASLLFALREAGAASQVATLLDRNPAAYVSLDDSNGVGVLLQDLHQAEATGQITTLASRAVAGVSLNETYDVAFLLNRLHEAGATGQVATLLDRNPAAHVSLDHPHAVATLLNALREAGATGQVATLLDRDPSAQVGLDSPDSLTAFLWELRETGATGQVTTLLDRDPAAHVSLGNPRSVAELMFGLRETGATSQATALASRAAAHTSLDSPSTVAELLFRLREAGATGQVATLLDRDPAAHVSLNRPDLMARLLDGLREAGATGQATALASRAAAHTSLDSPSTVAELLFRLREAEATGQITTLLDRDPTGHTSLDDPGAVGRLMFALRAVGATGQIAALLDRDPAAHVSPDSSAAVAALLDALRAAGAPAQAAKLIERLPAAGRFQLFCEQESQEDQFPFGREADGRPAKPWTWTDLG